MIRLIRFVADLYILIIIIRAVLSWIPHNPYQRMIQLVYQLTDPPLRFIRQFIPAIGGIDVSPIILIFAIYLFEKILVIIF